MPYSNTRFVTFSINETGSINYSQVEETSDDTLRLSTDGTLTFVTYIVPQPSSVANLTTKSTEYTYEQMTSLLTGSAWTGNVSPIPT